MIVIKEYTKGVPERCAFFTYDGVISNCGNIRNEIDVKLTYNCI